ncbi:MAG: hypothetical protein ACRCSU_11040 [Paracoccaceae bacterium]
MDTTVFPLLLPHRSPARRGFAAPVRPRALLPFVAMLAPATTFLPLSTARSAEIAVVDTWDRVTVVLVTGEIVPGDAAKFAEVTRDLGAAAIVLESPGGNLMEGLTIGTAIRDRGFGTGVAPDTDCASACALAWIAGMERFMDPTALIGFHSAYTQTEDRIEESGFANAMVAAYLAKLGFGPDVITFATEAAPEDMNWLTPEDARRIGIYLRILTADGKQVVIGGPREPVLPKGFVWIVTASAPVPQDLRHRFPGQQIVQVPSGMFAAVLGPFSRDRAKEMLATDPDLPADAYLTPGKGFVLLPE